MELTYGLVKAVLKPWLDLWFDWHIEGLEHIPPRGQGALLAFNHIAYLDPLAVAYSLNEARRVPRFLAKSELFESRKIGWVLRGARQIEVRRGSAQAPQALGNAVKALHDGEAVVVFPEGTITKDPDLRPMQGKSGIARLSLQSGMPVIPAAVWGTANFLPKGYRGRHNPGQDILVRIGEPMHFSGDPGSTAEWKRISGAVMDRIGALLASIRPAVPDRRRPKRTAA